MCYFSIARQGDCSSREPLLVKPFYVEDAFSHTLGNERELISLGNVLTEYYRIVIVEQDPECEVIRVKIIQITMHERFKNTCKACGWTRKIQVM